ncbi:MAG: hypothetical protein IJ365_01995 [Clostridia bacterium]|nr:hypothetical protein [Clostridia bacterium]
MNYKQQLCSFADRADALIGKLTLATKSEVIYNDVVSLTEEMHKAIDGCSDEMFYAAVYNAAATIRTAPEKCPVSQLRDALEDAVCEMRMMTEYFDD